MTERYDTRDKYYTEFHKQDTKSSHTVFSQMKRSVFGCGNSQCNLLTEGETQISRQNFASIEGSRQNPQKIFGQLSRTSHGIRTARTFTRGEMFDKRLDREIWERLEGKKLNVRNNFVENEQKCRRMTTTRILKILTLL